MIGGISTTRLVSAIVGLGPAVAFLAYYHHEELANYHQMAIAVEAMSDSTDRELQVTNDLGVTLSEAGRRRLVRLETVKDSGVSRDKGFYGGQLSRVRSDSSQFSLELPLRRFPEFQECIGAHFRTLEAEARMWRRCITTRCNRTDVDSVLNYAAEDSIAFRSYRIDLNRGIAERARRTEQRREWLGASDFRLRAAWVMLIAMAATIVVLVVIIVLDELARAGETQTRVAAVAAPSEAGTSTAPGAPAEQTPPSTPPPVQASPTVKRWRSRDS